MDSNIYYTCEDYFAKKYDKTVRSCHFTATTPETYYRWKLSTTSKLTLLLGLDKMEPVENPKAQLLETVSCEGYVRKKYILETEPNVFMPFYFMIPNTIDSAIPNRAVFAIAGHGGGGKCCVAGVSEQEGVAEAILQYNYAFGVELVKKGLIVICPDSRGFGERREKSFQGEESQKVLSSSCEFLNNMAIPLGLNVTGMWVWDLMCLMDWASKQKEIDESRIGCVGLSGGGLQTMWFTALDSRVKASIISGYFYGYKESLLKLENCSCNYVPHLWEYADMDDIAALIAPRPLCFETGNVDHLNGENGLKNVIPFVDNVRKAYSIFDAENKIHHHIFEGGHRFDGMESIPFLLNWL